MGQSLFDELFGTNQVGEPAYDIPFPVTELISRLESFQGHSMDGSPNPLPVAMIPLGRCISRYAASPDYFGSPRVVLATTLEDAGRAGTQLPFVKDRLFIGYQPETGSMEVISYNELAGRFEFQQVTNYGEGIPEVAYPDRNTCTACHQNQGPIFSQAPWDETDFNRDIYRSIAEASGVLVEDRMQNRNTDTVRIDGSTNRANKYGMFQEFWQNTCLAETEGDAIQCRAAQLEVLVRQRLHGQSRALSLSQRGSEFLVPYVVESAGVTWPEGIGISSSDVPNANPLADGAETHLASARDLLLPRKQTIKWEPDEIDLMVDGLASMIPLSDMRALDDRLYQLALLRKAAATHIEGRCWMTPSDPGTSQTPFSPSVVVVGLRCSLQDGQISNTYRLFGTLESESGKIRTNTVYRHIAMDSRSAILNLTHDGGVVEARSDLWYLALYLHDDEHGFHVRLPGRGIIDSLELWWPRSSDNPDPWDADQVAFARSRMRVIPDFDLVSTALDRLVSLSDEKVVDILTGQPFRGRQAIRALIRQLY